MYRFDFGVPLEDIFPPNDIHPRLKHLFEEAYKLYINGKLSNIEQVVRQLQGSLQARLKLKQKIIHDVHYDIQIEEIAESPGAYFWLIRHFLGLLPIPLLPTYYRQIHFDWIGLSGKCKNFLKCYESERSRKHQLDYELAENLNLLPFEHFLLLTILIHFIRKLSRKASEQQISRRALLFLCKYYCAAACSRPYIPGHKNEKIFPLFFYIALRWRGIERQCRLIGHPAYFLQNNCMTYETHIDSSIRNNCTQTEHFTPRVITIYKNTPYFTNNNNYLRDTSCQTEPANSIDIAIQNPEVLTNDEQNINVKSEQKKLSDQESDSLYPSLLDSTSTHIDISDKYLIKGVTSSPIEEKSNCNGDIYETSEFSFLSTKKTVSNIGDWNEVVKETEHTLRKVEEYIYDDYDTFSKEEYNQISEINKNNDPLKDKVSKIGWTYTPENSAREGNIKHNELENTYIKFEDVFEENGKYKTNECCDEDNELEPEENSLNVVFKKCNDSKTPLCNNSSVKSTNRTDENEGKSKKNFNLKRFKVKLDFLRVLTPKKSTYPSPSCSNVKYKKIKNIKSNTL